MLTGNTFLDISTNIQPAKYIYINHISPDTLLQRRAKN